MLSDKLWKHNPSMAFLERKVLQVFTLSSLFTVFKPLTYGPGFPLIPFRALCRTKSSTLESLCRSKVVEYMQTESPPRVSIEHKYQRPNIQ